VPKNLPLATSHALKLLKMPLLTGYERSHSLLLMHGKRSSPEEHRYQLVTWEGRGWACKLQAKDVTTEVLGHGIGLNGVLGAASPRRTGKALVKWKSLYDLFQVQSS
jgi:hypothetical protein